MTDLFGLGNALVDTEINVDDSFLDQYGIAKGHMTLVDDARMQELIDALTEHKKSACSGGSAANTIYAVQAFGYETAYACKVSDDDVGRFFLADMAKAGVQVNANAVALSSQSGRCLVLITPDAERTMNTNLGISAQLGMEDVAFDKLRKAKYFYVEGYLSSSEASTQATIACHEAAAAAGVATAVSLSDPSMVEFCRESLAAILGNGVEVLFCNEEEALSWARTDRLDNAIAELKDIAREVYLTVGAKGSMAISANGTQEAKGYPTQAVDTTGAGDMYAGACLAARLGGADPLEAARFGNHCASALVAQYGARFRDVSHYQLLRERFRR
ncbi:MAG: adenosine kinase [Pseudomonadales bacterium]